MGFRNEDGFEEVFLVGRGLACVGGIGNAQFAALQDRRQIVRGRESWTFLRINAVMADLAVEGDGYIKTLLHIPTAEVHLQIVAYVRRGAGGSR